MLVLNSCCLIVGVLALGSDPVSFEVSEERGLRAEATDNGGLRLTAGEPNANHDYAWVTALDFPDEDSFGLRHYSGITVDIRNFSSTSVETMFWVCGSRGWSAVGDFATLKAGETKTFSVNFRETFPDGTAKIDPNTIDKIQIMVRGAKQDVGLLVSPFQLKESDEPFELDREYRCLPGLSEGRPAPGKRVKLEEPDGHYSVLYLPPSWEAGKHYPVIVEYPGNIFFNAKCYSTGRPEQCVIGYGMSEGKGSIVLSLPFVDSQIPDVVENGFGNPDETVAYARSMIEKVIDEFGGDRERMVLTGFSRGSIACGFIGLRDDEIASYWKGIHGCQHYDGSSWRESTMTEAVERAKRFRGTSIFQTDNSEEKYAPVVEATDPDVKWTWVSSGLGFHSTAMFRDDRPSTLQLREWYRELVDSPASQ